MGGYGENRNYMHLARGSDRTLDSPWSTMPRVALEHFWLGGMDHNLEANKYPDVS